MRQAVVGLLAHVDAGKTTLAEAMLLEAGAIRRAGRVDDGEAHLDFDAMERERGITIFAAQGSLDHAGVHLDLVDAPGHVDFSAEAERTLAALDYALLVVGANDGVQSHTETLWDLLAERSVPAFVFVGKTDLPNPGCEALAAELRARLSDACLDGAALLAGDPAALEEAAATDEDALEEYLEAGSLSLGTLRRLVAERRVFPCFSGSALRGEGVRGLLDGICALVAERSWPEPFAARVWRVGRSGRGERLAWLKVTGGTLRAKERLEGFDGGAPWSEKVNELRVYQGSSHEVVGEVPAGRVCAATGLTRVVPGSALGAEPTAPAPRLAPVLSFQVLCDEGDRRAVVAALRELADEDPTLGVAWRPQLGELHVRLMGEVQKDVVARLLRERHGLEVGFGPGGVLYRETVTAAFEGVGHFEPLRHYAEARLLVEPLPRGSGVVYGSRCPEDDLARNWQRLILSCAMEREHPGTLAGYPLDDVRVTLVAGRAHPKHTEGGDFRQAAWRAIRQALMQARAAGAVELLEPWYRLRLSVPAERVGRAMSDLRRMSARLGAPEVAGGVAVVSGEVPASEVGEYALEVARYTGGRGTLSLAPAGYDACHDADDVVARAAYDPLADLDAPPGSVFCSHGAGHPVPWDEAGAMAHTEADPSRLTAWRPADAAFFSAG